MKQENLKKQSEENFGLFGQDGGQAFAGGFMIFMGVIFLMGVLGITVLGKSAWWLSALLPVYWIVVVGLRRYREDGRFSRRVLAILIWGLVPFAYVAGVALGLNVGLIWPLGIIVAGVGMLLYGRG